jgi:hypothetical protein
MGRYLRSSWATAGSKIRRAWEHAVVVAVANLAGTNTLCGYGEISGLASHSHRMDFVESPFPGPLRTIYRALTNSTCRAGPSVTKAWIRSSGVL